MREKLCNCPICGEKNINKTDYMDGIGICEEYYYCNKCGYGYEMAYSSPHEYIDLNDDWDMELLRKAYKGNRKMRKKNETEEANN